MVARGGRVTLRVTRVNTFGASGTDRPLVIIFPPKLHIYAGISFNA